MVDTFSKMAESGRWTKFLKISYMKVFGVANHESMVRCAKFKMADIEWWRKFPRSTDFPEICYMVLGGGLPITNMWSDL